MTTIDVTTAEADGQLEVRRWQEAYIKGDHFDQYRMIDTIKEALDPVKKKPGRVTRLGANMEWALDDLPGVHDIVEYETRLNQVFAASTTTPSSARTTSPGSAPAS